MSSRFSGSVCVNNLLAGILRLDLVFLEHAQKPAHDLRTDALYLLLQAASNWPVRVVSEPDPLGLITRLGVSGPKTVGSNGPSISLFPM